MMPKTACLVLSYRCICSNTNFFYNSFLLNICELDSSHASFAKAIQTNALSFEKTTIRRCSTHRHTEYARTETTLQFPPVRLNNQTVYLITQITWKNGHGTFSHTTRDKKRPMWARFNRHMTEIDKKKENQRN